MGRDKAALPYLGGTLLNYVVKVVDQRCAPIFVIAAPGQAIPYGGERVAYVSPELAAAFRAGDRLVVAQETGDLLHVPAA